VLVVGEEIIFIMRNKINFIIALAILLFIVSCEKGTITRKYSNYNKEALVNFKNAINEWRTKKSDNYVGNSITVYNGNNPMENCGIQHNAQLDSVKLLIGFDSLSLANLLSYYANNYQINTLVSESEIINRMNYLQNNIVTDNGYYQSSFVDNLIGISEEEKEVLNSYFSALKSVENLEERIEYSKYLEGVILSSNFEKVAKNRMLRTFSIFRYSTFYWDNYWLMQAGTQNGGGMTDLVDALAEYWATHGDHEVGVFEDGASVNLYASMVSLSYEIISGLF